MIDFKRSYYSEWCYWFALNIKGADKKRLEEVVIRSGDTKWCYRFACHVEGADIEKLQEVVVRRR